MDLFNTPPLPISTTASSSNTFWISGVIAIVLISAFIYWYFRPQPKNAVNLGPFVLKGTQSKPVADSTINVFEYNQIHSSLGNNFTLSFFVYMDDANNERIPISGPKGDFRFKPILTIMGVGTVTLDPIHQVARVRIQPLVSKAVIERSEATDIIVDNYMVARWNQITITLEGRTIDVYLNGALVKSALLENLPILYPVGILLQTSPDFSGQAGLFQAWPYRLTETDVIKNYKRNTDLRGKPLIPDVGIDFFNIFKKNLCDIGFCGFRFSAGPLQYIDYEFA